MNFKSLDYVMERYVGRRPELIRAENNIEELRKLIIEGTNSLLMGRSSSHEVYMKEINEHEANKKLEKEFKKLFRLKDIEIFWVKTVQPNALTTPKAYQYLDKNYSVDKDGVDINPKLKVYVNVHTGLFTHLNMTAGEVLAIILHEIGHNFYQSEFQLLTRFNPFIPVTSLIGAAIFDFDPIRRGVSKLASLKDIVADMLRLTKVKTFFEELGAVMNAFSLPTIQRLGAILSNPRFLAPYLANPMNTIFNYAVESHADSFAVDYGYGPQLATGLDKLEKSKTSIASTVPIWSFIKDFDALLYDITFQTFSGYPSNHKRQQQIVKRLEKALADPSIPPSLRKDAESQLKQCKEFYKNYMSIENDENKKRILTWTYRKSLDTLFRGGFDVRQLLLEIDGTYKEDWDDFEKEIAKK